MPICDDGSEPASGAPDWFTFTQSDLSNLLPGVGPFLTWAAMGIPMGPQNTAEFCATEPSGDLPDAADYAKLAIPPLALVSGTYRRFGNQARQEKFAEMCVCSAPASGTYQCELVDTWAVAVPPYSGYMTHTFNWIAGDTDYYIDWEFLSSSGGSVHWDIYQLNAANAIVSTDEHQTGTSGVGTTFHYHHTKQPTATKVQIEVNASALYADWTTNFRTWMCGTGRSAGTSVAPPPAPLDPPDDWPGAPDAPVCGDSQDICDALQTISNKLNVIDSYVQLIQRQAVPFAYLKGTPYTGLTGQGTISAQGIIGLVVDLTTVPAVWGSTAETPRRLVPSAASIQAQSSDGLDDRRMVHYEHQVLMLEAPWITDLHYNFRTGVVGTITILSREF